MENEDVYSPVARMHTLKVMLSVACNENWHIEQMDVQTAFLNGVIKSEVYIYPPDGYLVEQNKVFLLQKSLYGLRESPRDWYECFHNFMLYLNFRRSNYDYCLYIGCYNSNQVYIILYVDDLLIFSADKNSIGKIKTMLSNKFKMTDIGKVKQYLGIEIEQNLKERKITLSQEKYIEKVAEKYCVNDSKNFDTPMEINLKLEGAEIVEPNLKYRNLIGSTIIHS